MVQGVCFLSWALSPRCMQLWGLPSETPGALCNSGGGMGNFPQL